MDQMKAKCNFCAGTGKVSQVSARETRSEICFMCRGRGFSIVTIHTRDMNQSAAVNSTA